MEILKEIKKTRTFKHFYDIPFKLKGKIVSDLKIALICHPCFGFGDIIFCLKIYNYIMEWYSIVCTIFTTKPKHFIENGIKKVFLLKIPNKKYEECDNLKKMKIYNSNLEGKPQSRAKNLPNYDLIFVTPWIGTDFEPSLLYIKPFFPYTNKFNTFLFSEYNPSQPYKYDFPTGIGNRLQGLLLTNWNVKGKRIIKNPYLMIHLTQNENVNILKCFANFILMMCKKYSKKYPNLDVVCPEHIFLEEKEGLYKIVEKIKKEGYYKNVNIKVKGEKQNKDENGLTFRFDLLPMPYEKYVSMFNYCLPDVLITGDQSLTDIISCCKNYNIYYQIMPWKANLAKNLAIQSGSKEEYLRKIKTSCGSIGKISKSEKLKLNYVSEKFDFRKLAKPKLDRLVNNARLLTTNEDVKKYVEIVSHSRKKTTVLEKYKKYLEEKNLK